MALHPLGLVLLPLVLACPSHLLLPLSAPSGDSTLCLSSLLRFPVRRLGRFCQRRLLRVEVESGVEVEGRPTRYKDADTLEQCLRYCLEDERLCRSATFHRDSENSDELLDNCHLYDHGPREFVNTGDARTQHAELVCDRPGRPARLARKTSAKKRVNTVSRPHTIHSPTPKDSHKSSRAVQRDGAPRRGSGGPRRSSARSRKASRRPTRTSGGTKRASRGRKASRKAVIRQDAPSSQTSAESKDSEVKQTLKVKQTPKVANTPKVDESMFHLESVPYPAPYRRADGDFYFPDANRNKESACLKDDGSLGLAKFLFQSGFVLGNFTKSVEVSEWDDCRMACANDVYCQVAGGNSGEMRCLLSDEFDLKEAAHGFVLIKECN